MKLKSFYLLFSLCNMAYYLSAQNICGVCEKLKNNVVQITTTFQDGREENGFGTVISQKNDKLYVVTAKHVIYNINDKGLISADNKTTSVKVKFLSDIGKDYKANLLMLPGNNLDISLLEVDAPKNYEWSRDFYSKALQRGTKVWFIGRSGKWYIPTGSFVGSVNDVTPNDEIIIDINSIQPGTSGAPLVSADGIVGLIFEDALGGAKAYPVEKVIKLVSSWNYQFQLKLNSDVTQPDIAERDDKPWADIVNEKNEGRKIDKLETYVSKEQGSHVEDAKTLFENLLWANIDKNKYKIKYVQNFPQGKHINQVEDRWYSAVLPEFYLNLFPHGRYAEDAKRKLSGGTVDAETELWNKIKDGWDLEIKTYIDKYPQGKYITQLEELVWQKALSSEANDAAFKETGFQDYLKYFPTGKHIVDARAKIKKYKVL